MSGGEDAKRRYVARLHATVRGDVQGVGFRYFVQRQAQASGLSGWVRNLASGEVECLAEGSKERVERLLEQLREGPRGADVNDVAVEWQEARGDLNGFQVVH